ncbi:LDCC motif putative metal-binding protein [Clostridium sp. JNZ J1-5]|nr:LDCC motif putative metal-binding protein [Clostridium sp.]
MKKWLSNYIKKLAEENSKAFGNEKLDCCGLNRSNNNKKANNKNTTENKK